MLQRICRQLVNDQGKIERDLRRQQNLRTRKADAVHINCTIEAHLRSQQRRETRTRPCLRGQQIMRARQN